MQQFGIPSTSTNTSTLTSTSVQEWANDGAGFVQLTEQEFKDKLPQVRKKKHTNVTCNAEFILLKNGFY